MKNLIMIGAGGCGREVLQWARDINKVSPRWNIKGFLDDKPDALEGKICDVPVLASVGSYPVSEDDEFICCIGNSTVRKEITERLKARGGTFTTVIHPSAVITDSCMIGEGVVIYPHALVSDNAVIGDGCIINMYSSIDHDSVLGEYCTVSAHCDVTGKCRLGDHVFMGSTSQIIPGLKIGNNAYICAGSTVMARVRDGVKVLGNPARIIGF